MSNIEYRTIIKCFTLKGLNATEITEELKEVYDESTPASSTVAKWVAEFKEMIQHATLKTHHDVVVHRR